MAAARPKPEPAEVPHAVAIVMDGNGRWAKAHHVSVAEGHRAGSRALRPVVETAIDVGDDEERAAEGRVQKLTDGHTSKIDELLKRKEAEIMEV